MAGGMRAQVARPHIQGLVTCSLSLASLSLSLASLARLSLSPLFLASLSLSSFLASFSLAFLSRLSLTWSGREILASSNVQRFRGGLVVKAHRLCVSLNSRLQSNKVEENLVRTEDPGEQQSRERACEREGLAPLTPPRPW